MPKNTWDRDQETKLKNVEQNGQLMFVKTNDTAKIKTLPRWTEAFHVFVAIYCQKHPENIGHLMTYAQIVQGKAKSGKTFLRRIIDLTIGLSKPYHHRRLNKESRADLQA